LNILFQKNNAVSNILIEKYALKDEVIKKAKSSEVIKSYLAGNSIYKEIYIPQKVINFVVKQG